MIESGRTQEDYRELWLAAVRRATAAEGAVNLLERELTDAARREGGLAADYLSLREALARIALDVGCSEDDDECRIAFPDKPDRWCHPCVARHALGEPSLDPDLAWRAVERTREHFTPERIRGIIHGARAERGTPTPQEKDGLNAEERAYYSNQPDCGLCADGMRPVPGEPYSEQCPCGSYWRRQQAPLQETRPECKHGVQRGYDCGLCDLGNGFEV